MVPKVSLGTAQPCLRPTLAYKTGLSEMEIHFRPHSNRRDVAKQIRPYRFIELASRLHKYGGGILLLEHFSHESLLFRILRLIAGRDLSQDLDIDWRNGIRNENGSRLKNLLTVLFLGCWASPKQVVGSQLKRPGGKHMGGTSAACTFDQ